jgi:hypothetical protein
VSLPAMWICFLWREGFLLSGSRRRAFAARMLRWVEAMALTGPGQEHAINLVIRQVIAGQVEGFGITAYLSAKGCDRTEATAGLATLAAAFADALPALNSPTARGSKLQ